MVSVPAVFRSIGSTRSRRSQTDVCLHQRKRPAFFTAETRRVTSAEELASPDRYENYKGESASMIDRLYDKLLRVGKFPISNQYLLTQAQHRVSVMVDICLEFGALGTLPKIFQQWEQKQSV